MSSSQFLQFQILRLTSPDMTHAVPLPCQWSGCTYLEMTGDNTKLLDHLMEMHGKTADRLKCKWAGCAYTATFGRKHELKRHLRNQHINPGFFPCLAEGCGKVCKREDNLTEHMKRLHGDR